MTSVLKYFSWLNSLSLNIQFFSKMIQCLIKWKNHILWKYIIVILRDYYHYYNHYFYYYCCCCYYCYNYYLNSISKWDWTTSISPMYQYSFKNAENILLYKMWKIRHILNCWVQWSSGHCFLLTCLQFHIRLLSSVPPSKLIL